MANVAGKDSAVWVDNSSGTLTDMSTYFRSLNGMDLVVAMLDSTAFGSAAMSSIPGLKQGNSITGAGNWDPTSYAHFIALFAAQTASSSWTLRYSPAGTGTGKPFLSVEFLLENVSSPSDYAGTVQFSVSMKAISVVTTGTH